ncbi:MAG: deacylase [Thermodesulfobacteriota bacterium]|nr:MAG: deacylase [Thermodesulfobacteriota bacterium]
MPDKVIINGQEILPGQNVQINLNVAKLPTHTMIDLPVFVFRGRKKGPRLLIMAGIHGDELNGVESIRRLIVNKSVIPNRGMVIAVPIVNVYGFLNRSRYLPDGRDLNRSFPGTKTGSLASRVAHKLMTEILPVIDYGIDLHTGGANDNYPQVRCTFDIPDNLTLARAFAPPFIINSKLRDDSLRKAAHEMGKTMLVFEGGEALRFDEIAIKEGMNGTKRLMKHLKMRDSKPRKLRAPVEIQSTSWIRARNSGIYRAFVNYGDPVKKNQIIASITDPFGETEHKIKSATDGHIIGVRSLPIVNRGDALINLGIEGNEDNDLESKIG